MVLWGSGEFRGGFGPLWVVIALLISGAFLTSFTILVGAPRSQWVFLGSADLFITFAVKDWRSWSVVGDVHHVCSSGFPFVKCWGLSVSRGSRSRIVFRVRVVGRPVAFASARCCWVVYLSCHFQDFTHYFIFWAVDFEKRRV